MIDVVANVINGTETVRLTDSIADLDLIMMNIRLGGDVAGIDAMNRIRQDSNSVKNMYITFHTKP